MAASLKGPWAKVGRSEHHLEVLECKIACFIDRHPVRVTVQRDLKQAAYIFHVHDIADIEVDPTWGLILGDCVHNARSALDHLVYQLAVAKLGRALTDGEAKNVMFPIYPDATRFRANGRRWIALLDAADQDRIETLQIYNAWDEGIWGPHSMPGPPAPVALYLDQLSTLDNTDKHRIVHPVWLTPGLGATPRGFRELGITGASTNDRPLYDGAEIGRWYFSGEPPPDTSRSPS